MIWAGLVGAGEHQVGFPLAAAPDPSTPRSSQDGISTVIYTWADAYSPKGLPQSTLPAPLPE